MIIARSPLRISLGGGGTDLPSYYRQHGGFVIAGAICAHVYVAVHRRLEPGYLLRHACIEQVETVEQIEHPLIRAALAQLGVHEPLEITTMADLPAGMGLGSSGAFGTALLKALHQLLRRSVEPQTLAELACHLEMNVLGAPVGKQDPYAAAFGGLNCYEFRSDDSVTVTPLRVSDSTIRRFYEHALLFSTGIRRAAPALLMEQDQETRAGSLAMVNNLHEVKRLGLQFLRTLELGDLEAYGRLLHEHWEHKKHRAKRMSSAVIDRWYEAALESGASGGKLIGAGGGGFLLFLTQHPAALRLTMARQGLQELRYCFDPEGVRLMEGAAPMQAASSGSVGGEL